MACEVESKPAKKRAMTNACGVCALVMVHVWSVAVMVVGFAFVIIAPEKLAESNLSNLRTRRTRNQPPPLTLLQSVILLLHPITVTVYMSTV